MEGWTDHGFVLSARKHGEGSAVVHLLTVAHGRHGGLVRGGFGKASRGILQPGNAVSAAWVARLDEHLGHFTIELTCAHAARVLHDPGRLAALASACAVADLALPERQPHPAAHAAFAALAQSLDSDAWPTVYVHFELALLRDLGFGLDLTACALTGTHDNLRWVSPKTGRAVSEAAGEPWRGKLLPLPAFLLSGGEGDAAGIAEGLRLTGYFLEKHAVRSLPAARLRLAQRFG